LITLKYILKITHLRCPTRGDTLLARFAGNIDPNVQLIKANPEMIRHLGKLNEGYTTLLRPISAAPSENAVSGIPV